jgi:DNA-binding beta-propeller fold protein YncE
MMPFRFFNRMLQEDSVKPVGTPGNRVRLLGLLAFFTLTGTGCATTDMVHDPAAPRALLQRWTDLTGAQTGMSRLGPPSAAYITLRRPTAMSARDNEVYLIDAGLNQIFHYNRFQQTLVPFTNLPVNADMSIYAAPDRTVYIADPHSSAVLHFTSDGAQLPSLVSPGNLARPVSVAVNERNGQVLVADGLLDQFISFNSLGMPLSVVKPQHALAIAAMTTGPDGIYVADRIDKQVSVLGWDGTFRYSLGAHELGAPGAIAVSRDNLVFVSDNFDQTIKVYRGQGAGDGNTLMMAKFGGVGAGPGSFNGIAGLAVDGNVLYATDSLNARVQIMLINR